MKNLLLIYGGGGTEHEVSLRSAEFFRSKIDTQTFQIINVEIDKTGAWKYQGQDCFLNFKRQLISGTDNFAIDVALPCIHGVPNETGQLPALFELMHLPYFGCNQETSVFCFNKMTTKLWLEHYGVSTTPFLSVSTKEDLPKAKVFFKKHQDIFVKATNQGSSVGCYHCTSEADMLVKIEEAFKLSPFVILEKTVHGREFELSTFDYQGKSHFTHPCEIFSPENEFYTYDEKYSDHSQTNVELKADLPVETVTEMQRQAKIAYEVLKIRHLSRMDFFLSPDGEVFLNEINTLPGHTSISMFPSMMESYGIKYEDYLQEHLLSLLK